MTDIDPPNNIESPPHLLIVGNIVCDIIATIKPGEHEWGTLSHVDEPITLSPGGNGAIAALAAARLGLSVKLAGKIGSDLFSDLAYRWLTAGGVDCSLVIRMDGPGSATVVLSDPKRDRIFHHYTGPNRALHDMNDIIGDEVLSKTDALLVTSYFLLPGFDGNTAKRLMRRAKEFDIPVFLDVSWDESGRWDFEGVLEHVDYQFLNSDEGQAITGLKGVKDMAEPLLALGPGTVIIKLGKNGVYIAGPNIREHIPPYKIITKETTGCGDVFNAAFIYAILDKKNIQACAEFAAAAGAYAAQFRGAENSLPAPGDIHELIRKTP